MLLCACKRRAFSPFKYPLHPAQYRRPLIANVRNMSDDSTQNVPAAAGKPRYIDIGINLTDPVYRGIYHGEQRHPDDLLDVLSRAKEAGCKKLILTGSDVAESKKAIELAKQHPGYLYCTVGVHPCSSQTFTKHPEGPTALLTTLQHLAESHLTPASSTSGSSPIVAFGEIGLDYDRLMLCPQAVQLQYFALQLDIAVSLGNGNGNGGGGALPLFLHSRAAHADFVRLLRERLAGLPRRGVVHSFTGTLAEMRELVALGFDIGVNGCSLKTAENVEVVRAVPWERLQLETDGPWCEMRPGHASAGFWRGKGAGSAAGGAVAGGEQQQQQQQEEEAAGERWKSVKKERWVKGALVKGRNEPCLISRVALAVAGIRGVSVEEVTERAWENSVRMFGLGER